ncbi:hypothetical protein CcaverHIS002_0507150 [Cutaneotrichosporon cavernicola]|uniref:Up-regulated during septation protein 1 domain-containing protein n=1 Tax=Cutaneotrichosporon cavernicola TaxID=279322 RepID=A0AA48L738_9TREE|nr:uncharacterized protein CcaverHIS019_0507700 [Cutaneotrichosporon cavernicola]BEI85314.1 hypothetical protein CcaverHIS002_0507150 [Cutaneotrichosporon cavernicola]BEI93142.1 hypothetical protein CcaverHIS019_0507700 [Cutaneotrichosporon cavernicola]BEJ00918.1 hypothetical protein CcaverHIS631_0507750 [Cutaneotrichosporon cavernicola]BEJ08684.1 hypothetical protein CcaverHIS641_0507780 [Cutaneotrichosporon cavernicola]
MAGFALMRGSGGAQVAFPQPPQHTQQHRQQPTKIPKASFLSRIRRSQSPTPVITPFPHPNGATPSPSNPSTEPSPPRTSFSSLMRGSKPPPVTVPDPAMYRKRNMSSDSVSVNAHSPSQSLFSRISGSARSSPSPRSASFGVRSPNENASKVLPPMPGAQPGMVHSKSTSNLVSPAISTAELAYDMSSAPSTAGLAYAASSSGPSTAGLPYASSGPPSADINQPHPYAQLKSSTGSRRRMDHMGTSEVLAQEPSSLPGTFGRASRNNAPPSESDYGDNGGYSSSTSEDRFTPIPRPNRKLRSRPSNRGLGEEVRVAREALESPPPHVRRAPDETVSGNNESAFDPSGTNNTSPQTGVSASSLGLDIGQSPMSTGETHVTAHYSPSMHTAVPPIGAGEINTSLLATQAALDCESLLVGSWDEAEKWKKELSAIAGSLRAAQTKYNRELKFLAISKKVAHLDSSAASKRDSTIQSLATLQHRVDVAEKELQPLHERESALRRRLNEHYAGVLARELRQLQRRESQSSRQPNDPARALEEAQNREYHYAQRIQELEQRLAAGATAVGSRDVDATSSPDVDSLRRREYDLARRLEEAEALIREQSHALEGERERFSRQIRMLEAERDIQAKGLSQIEAERDIQAKGLSQIEAERNEHLNRAQEHANRLQDLELTVADHVQHIRHLESERDSHAQQSRQLQTERDAHADRIRVFETQKDTDSEQLASVKAELATIMTQLRTTETDRDGFTQLSRGHEQDITRLTDRVEELEEQLTEAHRREGVLSSNQRALEENARSFDSAAAQFSKDRDEWLRERDEIAQQHHQVLDSLVAERDGFATERDDLTSQRDDLVKKCSQLADQCDELVRERGTLSKERDGLAKEREGFVMERDARELEHQTFVSRHETTASLNRTLNERIGASLGALLGRAPFEESEIASAVDEAAAQMARRDRDIARLRQEVQDITAANEGADTDFMRVSSERDEWKQVAEDAKREAAAATTAHRSTQDEHMELVRKMRTQNTEIMELKQRITGDVGSPSSSPELIIKVAKLETELANVNTALTKAWSVLPAPAASGDAGLNDPRIVSPNSYINFAALQRAYAGAPATDKYPGIDELLDRIQSVVRDGRILVERMANLEKDKERHKANASKAAKLVENSQQALETYKRQVGLLEEQLDTNQLALESYQRQAAELEDQLMYKSAVAASEQEGDLERALAGLRDTKERNVQLTVDLGAKTTALAQLEDDIDQLRNHVSRMEKENEDERRRFQEQHMVILDEMNQAHEQNETLRTKLRAANASTTSVNRVGK